MSNSEINELCGPYNAENFQSDYEDYYVISNANDTNIKNDKYISSVLGQNRVVLTGVRGTGKTMILKVSHELLEKELIEAANNFSQLEVLPVYISFSGFKEEVQMLDKAAINSDNQEASENVFRSYLFITMLNEVLNEIAKAKLDDTLDFNFFGLRTKLQIKNPVQKAIHNMQVIGFKQLTQDVKKAGALNFSLLDGTIKAGTKTIKGAKIQSTTISNIQKIASFKETINSICKTYGIQCIHFFFDEVFYLNYLQSSFFDALFGFRNDKNIKFTISCYPTYMDYGESFDIPDDAKEVSVSNNIYRPNKNDYENSLIRLINSRINKFHGTNYSEVIDEEALKRLILIFNGNPRMLMQSIDYLWNNNEQTKITKNNINQQAILEMEDKWYELFLKNQARRYKLNLANVKSFLKVITDRITEYNNKQNNKITIYFAITNDIEDKYSETIDLLHYCRFIEPIKITSLGGSTSKKAQLYSVTPIVLWAVGAFPNKKIANMEDDVFYSTNKDAKVQLSSVSSFESKLDIKNNSACPKVLDETCDDHACGETYSEAWTMCPFHMYELTRTHLTAAEISIDELEISERIISRLKNNNFKTIKDILTAGISGLKEVPYIKDARANQIYVTTKEYVDDHL